MKTLTSFYEVLGISASSDTDTIRKAYRRLARRHHPDVSGEANAHEMMARINEAFQTLIDEGRRNEYDAMLAGGGMEMAVESPKQDIRPVTVKLKHRLRSHLTPVYTVDFAPDTGELVSTAFDNEVLWWDAELGIPSKRTKVDAGVISTIRILPEEKLVAAGSSESVVTFWHLNGPLVDSWRGNNEEWVSCVAISSDGRAIATGSMHKTVQVSSTLDGSVVFKKDDHTGAVTAVAWSQDGKYLATGSADATIKLWHAQSGALLHTFRQVRSTVTALAFSPDNGFLAASAVDLSVRVFSLESGMLEKMMYGHTRPIEALAFHPNGWLLASGSRDGTVGLWNAAKGIGNLRIEASTRPIACVAFSPDGDRLAAGGQDKLVRVWEVSARDQSGRSN